MALLAALIVGLVAVVVVSLMVVRAVSDFDPFGSETVDRSQPAVLKSIEKLSDYRAATANLQVIVDVEKDSKLLPSAIKGERVLFIAAGSVDASVDFSKVGAENVRVNEDRTAVTINLPRAKLGEARVDPARSRVYDRKRGILDRIESVFEESPTEDRPLFVRSEQKLLEAARADEDLLPTAERNTRAMLEGMMTAAGFERVTVTFGDPGD